MASEKEHLQLPYKDLPPDPQQKWSAPKAPKDRHLSTEFCPFSEYQNMRKRIGGNNTFFPRSNFASEHYEALLNDPVMKALKDDYTFTPFSMEPDSILFLKDAITMFKPQVVLELGSGISTPILASAQKEQFKAGGKVQPIYVTIDQSQDYLDQTMALVKKVGADDIVKPLLFPMCYYKVGNQTGKDQQVFACYDFDEQKLHEACGGVKPDMIIVDGPTGGGEKGYTFARMLTIPILSQYAADDAVYFMDDAYRDTEALEMQRWAETRSANVLGIKAVGKGLMIALK
jgi:hypothetical protein